MSSLQDSIQFFSTKFDEFKDQLDNLEALGARVIELETKNKHLEETASSVSERLNKLEQSSHCNDLIISGIPVLEKEGLTTLDVVVKFVNQINNIKISNQDIRSANRIIPRNTPSKHKGELKPQKILVNFYSGYIRDAAKLSIRIRKKESPVIDFEGATVNFYAADYLTPYYNQLLYSARDFAKNNNYSQAWVSNSKILLKKSKTSLPIFVNSINDLHKLTNTRN
jgi:hypothetical protein